LVDDDDEREEDFEPTSGSGSPFAGTHSVAEGDRRLRDIAGGGGETPTTAAASDGLAAAAAAGEAPTTKPGAFIICMTFLNKNVIGLRFKREC